MHLLEQIAIFLLTAVLLVPLFQRFKLGAVLGYLAAGMLIGPWGLGVIGAAETTLQFAEFGVVLLLGLFFMAVGMSANLGLLGQQPLVVLALAAGLALLKFALMYVVARVAGSPDDVAQRVAAALSQGGEFAFALFAAAGAFGVFESDTTQLLVMGVTLSMLLARRLERVRAPEFDTIDGPGTPVIIAGYGRFGQIVSRVLRMCGVPFTALEASYQQVDFVRRFGSKVQSA